MEKLFNQLCEGLFSEVENNEALTLSFSGENSQFIRINNASIRQTGLVDDANLGLKFISNNRTCEGSITVSGDYDIDLSRGKSEIERMRSESKEILEDPFLVMPTNSGSSREIINANGLQFDHAVEALLPSMQGVDLVGIFSNGKMFRGNANSFGQKHWFETESHCLDYSLVTPERQMVKGTYAGTDWDQQLYESYVSRSIEKLELNFGTKPDEKSSEIENFGDSRTSLCLILPNPLHPCCKLASLIPFQENMSIKSATAFASNHVR